MFDNHGTQFPQKILQASSLSAACRGKLSEVWITVVSCQCTDCCSVIEGWESQQSYY